MPTQDGQWSILKPLLGSNRTMDPISSVRLPTTLIDAFIPGYSFLAQVLLDLGIDISVIVSFIAFVGCAWTALRFAFSPIGSFVLETLSSSVTIEEWDPIFKDILNWVAANRRLQNIRLLRAYSPRQYNDEFDDANLGDQYSLRSQEKNVEDMIFNFNDWAARAPPKFQPHRSSGFFWHKRRIFRITRIRERVASDWGPVHEREYLNILVMALSAQPVKNLIEEAREFHLRQQTSTTTIQRPTPKAQRGRRNVWTAVATRPSRSMATVVLENDQKAAILKDINVFLHPRTARWYSNRGIPYRRGYLFHGPPGTGKTSLSFALAGVFGLDIYCLALSEVSLSEEDLIVLFNSLPKRCILLLEDIDSAGVTGKQQQESEEGNGVSSLHLVEEGSASKAPVSTKKKKKSSKKKDGKRSKRGDIHLKAISKPNTITLSGLLNAIDGVASQEGRVLILTTNHPEKLNEALIRPGRVDLQIRFDLANKQQMKDLFLRMYCPDPRDVTRQPTRISQILPKPVMVVNQGGGIPPASAMNASPTTKVSVDSMPFPTIQSAGQDQSRNPPTPLPANQCPQGKDSKDMLFLADRFADALPELQFSPAEIQGFLLMRKNDPGRAVLDVTEWRDTELAKRGGKASELSTSGVSVEKQLRTDAHADVDVGPETSRAMTTAAATINTGVTDSVPKPTVAEAEAKSNEQTNALDDSRRRDLSRQGLETSTPPSMTPSNTPVFLEGATPTESIESNGQVHKQAVSPTVERAVDPEELRQQQQHTDTDGDATEQRDPNDDANITKDQLALQDMVPVQALLTPSLPLDGNEPPPASGESSDTSDGSSGSSRSSSSSASRHSDDDEDGIGNDNDSDSDDSDMGSEPPLATESVYFD